MNNVAINNEKRKFSRIFFDAPVTLKKQDRAWDSTLIDICLNGALVKRPADWSAEDKEEIELQIELQDGEHTIMMETHLTHEEDDHLGFKCDHIDLDSITTLKRLVELNVGDEDVLNRELRALIIS